MPVRHSPCLLIPPPFLLTHQFSRTLTFSSKDAVGRFAMARAACCTSCLPSLVAALENAKFLFLVDISKWKFPRKSRSFLTSGVFESVRFKRKRGQVERVAGLAVEEGGEASNPPRGGGGETEVDRSAAGAPRASANEGHGAAKNPSGINCQRHKESTERGLALVSDNAYGGGTLSPPPIFVIELAKSLSALVL